MDYVKRFNKIYRYLYDIPSWSCYPISEEIFGFINTPPLKNILSKNSSILDAGCGRGRLLIALENLGFNNTFGADVSNVAVEYAKNQVNSSIVIETNFTKKTLFLDKSFDLILDLTMTSSLNPYYWPKTYQEFNRLLKNGGYFISEMFARPKNRSLSNPLTKKSKLIPDNLDQIYGVTEKNIKVIMGHLFTIIKIIKSYPDSLGRFYILAKKSK